MQISSLGHTECLVECVCKNGSTWRLLVDSWLSDFSVADLMERTPRVKIDWAKLPKIDAIFISHAHMDHLDPYFLTEIYQHQNPVLLLTETLEYLMPTLQKYLPNAAVEILENQKTQCYNEEIFITGLIFAEDRITNEDDVMTLHVAHA
jgi:L-ascorbate metabolism protein UlaG (beta-lactamase superfamily)